MDMYEEQRRRLDNEITAFLITGKGDMNNLHVSQAFVTFKVHIPCLYCGEPLDVYDVKDGEIDLSHEEGDDPLTVKDGYAIAPDNCPAVIAGDENFMQITEEGKVIVRTYGEELKDVTAVLPEAFVKVFKAYAKGVR